MADESQQEAQEDSAPYDEDADWYLQEVVEMVHGTELKIPITLFVEGLVVSGLLISGHLYFQAVGNLFRGGKGEDSSLDALAKTLGDSIADDYLASFKGPPRFVHLEDAKVFAPGERPMPTDAGVWWRGRLSRVSGFNFGTLGIGPAT